MKLRLTASAVAGIAVALVAMPSVACVVPVMTEQQWADARAEAQARAWDEAESVIVARVVSTGPAEGTIPGLRRTTFAPALTLKGEAPPAEFVVRQTAFTTCGPHPGYHALTAHPDEFYIVLASKPWSEDESVTVIYQLSFVTDPDLLAAWSAAYAAEQD